MKFKKLTLLASAAALCAVLIIPTVAMAKSPKTELDLNGQHYTLNLIGKDKPMPGDYNNAARHTMFVPLNTSEERIPLNTIDPSTDEEVGNNLGSDYLSGIRIDITQGEEFAMIDGNATDDSDGDGYLDGAFQLGSGSYNVVIAVKAKSPKYEDPYTDITGWMEGYDEVGDLWYYLNLGTVNVKKNGSWTDATDLFFVSDQEDPFDIVGAEDAWVFDYMQALDEPVYDEATGELLSDFSNLANFWQFDNNGNKLIQVRFYPMAR